MLLLFVPAMTFAGFVFLAWHISDLRSVPGGRNRFWRFAVVMGLSLLISHAPSILPVAVHYVFVVVAPVLAPNIVWNTRGALAYFTGIAMAGFASAAVLWWATGSGRVGIGVAVVTALSMAVEGIWAAFLPLAPVGMIVWQTGVGAVVLTWAVRTRIERNPLACPVCGYDLRASANGFCPECGGQAGIISRAEGD